MLGAAVRTVTSRPPSFSWASTLAGTSGTLPSMTMTSYGPPLAWPSKRSPATMSALASPSAARLAAALGLANADIVAGDLLGGHAKAGPYDVIVMEGSVPDVPDKVLAQLKEGGRLVTVRTAAPNMRQGKAYLFVRVDDEARGVAHFDAGASPLPGFAPAPAFTLSLI